MSLFCEHIPDDGQEHAVNGDDGFLVTATSLDAAITYTKFRMIFGFNNGIGNLNEKRFKAGARLRDTG